MLLPAKECCRLSVVQQCALRVVVACNAASYLEIYVGEDMQCNSLPALGAGAKAAAGHCRAEPAAQGDAAAHGLLRAGWPGNYAPP